MNVEKFKELKNKSNQTHTSVKPSAVIKKGIICTQCGSNDVSCEAVINPNTGKIIRYNDESLDYGWCEKCNDCTVLTDADGIRKEIKEKHDQFVSVHKKSPEYFYGMVIFKDKDEPILEVAIKLNLTVVENEDNKIFFYCKDAGELLSLTEFGREDFIIIGYQNFY